MPDYNPGPSSQTRVNQSGGVVATWTDNTGTALEKPDGTSISVAGGGLSGPSIKAGADRVSPLATDLIPLTDSGGGMLYTVTPTELAAFTAKNARTPFQYGAVGDGTADDSTPVQNCVNSGYCVLPAGYTFKVTTPIKAVNNGVFIGQGRSSVLSGSSIVGGVFQIGDGGITTITSGTYGNFRISGTATNALKINNAINLCIDKIWADYTSGVDSGVAPVWSDAFYFEYTFSNQLTNLYANGATIGSSTTVATFTGSVGGATTGTLNASFANGLYDFVFSNGQRRPVTITGNTTATWSTALTAGTVLTAYWGSCFRCGGFFSANYCSNWQTGGTEGMAYNFYLSDDNNIGGSAGNTFDALNASGGVVGLYIGRNHSTHTINGFYSETSVQPVILGNSDLFLSTFGHTFNSPVLSGQNIGHAGYALRVATINFDYVFGVTVNSPNFLGCYGIDQQAPLTFSGGGSPTSQAKGYGIVNAAGVIKAAVITWPGAGYGSNPSVAVGGSGSNGAVSAVQSGGTVVTAGLTVTNGGSGYSVANAIMPITYFYCQNVQINSPYISTGTLSTNSGVWPWVVRAAGSSGQGITIINDTAQQYGDSGANYYTPANLQRIGGAFGNNHWLSYLTGSSNPPTTNWVLVAPPAFP